MAAAVQAMRVASSAGSLQRSKMGPGPLTLPNNLADFKAAHESDGSSSSQVPSARKLAFIEHIVQELLVKQKLQGEALHDEISKLPAKTAKVVEELLAGSSDIKDRLAVSEIAANNELVEMSALKAIEERLEKIECREHVAREADNTAQVLEKNNALVGGQELNDTSDERVAQSPCELMQGQSLSSRSSLASRPRSSSSVFENVPTFRDSVIRTHIERDENHFSMLKSIANEIATYKDDKSKQQCLHRFVMSRPFNVVCMLVVILNALWLGYESDHIYASETWFKWVSMSFNIWFVIELSIRIVSLRKGFIKGPDRSWNLLDALCVLISIPEIFSDSALNLSFLRIIRLCKLSKALRLVRVLTIVTSLRLILITIFHTLGSLFWSFVAMLFVAYNFAILLLQAVSMHVDDGCQFGSATTENFNSVWQSILALFSMITGGQDWFEVAQDMGRNGGYLAEYLLMFWIFFATFGLINVVVAVFCAQAVDAGESQDMRLSREGGIRAAKITELMQVFRMIDSESHGSIGWEQFHEFATDHHGGALLESNGLQLFALEPAWRMMVGHREKDVQMDMAHFVMGFLRLSSQNMSTDFLLLSEALKDTRHELRETLDNLCKYITDLRCETSPVFV